MDAAYTTLKKTAFFLSFALLCLGPWSSRAGAQTLSSSCSAVGLTSTAPFSQCTLSSSTSTSIAYTGTITYLDSSSGWLSVNNATANPFSGSAAPGGTLIQIGLGNTAGLAAGTHSATITLTPTTAGIPAVTISVTFTPGNGTGGTGGLVTATPTSLSFCPTCTATQSITLSTSSTTPITFSVSAPSWLYVYQTAGTLNTVSSASSATLTAYVQNFSTAVNGQNLVITYSGTTALNVPISVTGGSTGNGVITLNPSSVTLNYQSGGTSPTATVNFTDNGAITNSVWYATSTVTNGDPAWLSLTEGPVAFNGNPTVSLFVFLNSGVLGQLSNGTHTGTINISDSPGGNTAQISVILNVNGSSGGSGGLTVSPSAITLQNVALGATNTVVSSASIISNVSGSLTYSLSGTCSGISVGFSSNSLTAGFGITMTVTGNPNGYSNTNLTDNCTISLGLYTSTLVASASVPVTWVIGSGSGGTGTGASGSPVLPTALSFDSQNGGVNSLVPQAVTINASGAWTATASASWISVAASGTGPGTTAVSINPAGLTSGSYNGTINFTTPLGSQTVSVTLLITSGTTPVLYANPTASFSVQDNSGTIIGSTQFQILASDNSAIPFTATTTASWLVLNSPSSDTTPTFGSFSINPATLGNGVYSAAITITSTAAGNPTFSIPVVLTVTGSGTTGGTGTLTFSTSALTFGAQVNGATPAAQTLTVTNPSVTTYTVSSNGTNNGITWLSIQPAGAISAYSQNFTVNVLQAGLPIGSYSGFINFSTGQQVTVTLNVSTTGGSGGTVTVSPSALSFTANQTGQAPAGQALTVTATSGSVGGTVSTTEMNGTTTTWLTTNVTTFSPTSGLLVTVTVNQTGLSAGTYTGAVVITPTGGTPVSVPVTFTVVGLPVITASPTALNLAYSVGGTPPTATINVTGGTSLSYLATVTSPCGCIAVAPASGDTTSSPSLTVSITNPTSLTAGTYTGTITVTGTNNSTGATTITVNLTVTAPLPTISAVVNSASGAGGALSPGEVVSIFGPTTNPIGPTTPVALSGSNLVNGNVPTTGLGGVKVTFNGYPAAVIYASATQVNAVVPYEVAGFSAFPVIVSYLGQTSNGFVAQTTTTAPGIFTQNGAGTGPADVLNANGTTVNGPNSPAAKGSTVSVYMTGEGATTPKGVDGAVTCSAGCSTLSQIPIPLLPVSVLVDGQPATVVFYGEAPGLVSGVMQVNFVVPAAARTGTVSLVVSVGNNQSQQNVTIAVQ